MAVNKQQSLTMAARLKDLRVSKGLSHEKLSKALMDKYGIRISSDSLMNYEVSEEYRTRAYANQGMRAEYLRCFADFYGVSSDYLLGISEVKSADATMQATIKFTGLTEESIEILRLAQKTVETYQHVKGLGSIENMNPDVKRLSDIMQQSGFVERYQFPVMPSRDPDIPGYTQMCYDYANFLIDFVDIIISAVTTNGEIIDDYMRFCDHTPCKKIETDEDRMGYIIGSCFSSGGVHITEPEYARFKAGEIAKSIDRYLIKEYVDGND